MATMIRVKMMRMILLMGAMIEKQILKVRSYTYKISKHRILKYKATSNKARCQNNFIKPVFHRKERIITVKANANKA